MYKILCLIISLLCADLLGQGTRPRIIRIVQAESLSFDREHGDAQVLRGNVICEHEGTLLHCDTALVYEKENRMVASGHILITKGDSIRVTGNRLVYDGRTRMASLTGNVRCVENDMVLTTEFLTFDTRHSIANYFNGGTIVNRENVLVSKNGHYYSARKEAAFHYSVVLTNPDYKMVSDTLKYHFPTKTAYFLGPTTITGQSDVIYCENGWYDTGRELSRFSRNAVLRTKEQTLRADSLTYDRGAGVGRGFRNVTLVDSAQRSVLYGEFVEYRKLAAEAFATGAPLFSRLVNNDSLHLTADTLYHRDVDSVNNFLAAYHHVRIFKTDLQALSDSATLSSRDSLLKLYDNPILWSGRMQATSREMEVVIGKSAVKGFRLSGRALLAQQVDSVHANRFHQLTGKTISGIVIKDTVRKVTVNGNAEMLYYPANKQRLAGLNHTQCSEIDLWFRRGDIYRSSLRPNTTGQVQPLREVSAESATLKGFRWMPEKRPKGKRDQAVPQRN